MFNSRGFLKVAGFFDGGGKRQSYTGICLGLIWDLWLSVVIGAFRIFFDGGKSHVNVASCFLRDDYSLEYFPVLLSVFVNSIRGISMSNLRI